MTVQNNKTKKLMIIASICIIFVSALLIGFMLFNENDNTQEPLLDNELTQEISNQEDGEDIIIDDIDQEDLLEDVKKEEYYSVIFLDNNGDTLQSKLFKKGSTPYYNGKSLSSNSRKFNTWVPSISVVNGNQAYIATYLYPESSFSNNSSSGSDSTPSSSDTTSSSNNNSSSGSETSTPSSNTYASIVYKDIEGNQQSLILESGTTINFSAGEHGTYDSIPSPITLTDNQQLDITSSTYNPSKVEVNYIFKGFSYSGNTMKCEYSLASNTVNVDLKKYSNVFTEGGVKYAELDCIRTSGTQYINLGSQTMEQSKDVIESKFSYSVLSSSDSALWLYSCQSSGASIDPTDFYSQNNKFMGRIMGRSSGANFNQDTEIHILKVDMPNSKIYLDGVGISTSTSATTTGDLNLFRRNTGTGYGSINLYYFVYTKNGTKVFDLKPAIRLSDKAKGLFDSVGKRFYSNNGTGTFGGDIITTSSPNAGKIYASGSYETGPLTLTAVANDGHIFVGWLDNVSDSEREISIGDNTVYIALFEPN